MQSSLKLALTNVQAHCDSGVKMTAAFLGQKQCKITAKQLNYVETVTRKLECVFPSAKIKPGSRLDFTVGWRRDHKDVEFDPVARKRHLHVLPCRHHQLPCFPCQGKTSQINGTARPTLPGTSSLNLFFLENFFVKIEKGKKKRPSGVVDAVQQGVKTGLFLPRLQRFFQS